MPPVSLPRPALARAALACAIALLCDAGRADPGYYVATPYGREGALVAELRYWTVKPRGGPEAVWPELGLSYGVTRRWTTGVLASGLGPSPWDVRVSSWNWLNNLVLTGDDTPVDVALHAQLIRERSQPWAEAATRLEFGPLVQVDAGLSQFNANAILERELAGPSRAPVQLKLQWQWRHRVAPQWRLGLQGFSELGEWDDWLPGSRQSHRAGPAVFASFPLAGGGLLQLQGAALVGKTYGERGHMVTLRATLTRF